MADAAVLTLAGPCGANSLALRLGGILRATRTNLLNLTMVNTFLVESNCWVDAPGMEYSGSHRGNADKNRVEERGATHSMVTEEVRFQLAHLDEILRVCSGDMSGSPLAFGANPPANMEAVSPAHLD